MDYRDPWRRYGSVNEKDESTRVVSRKTGKTPACNVCSRDSLHSIVPSLVSKICDNVISYT